MMKAMDSALGGIWKLPRQSAGTSDCTIWNMSSSFNELLDVHQESCYLFTLKFLQSYNQYSTKTVREHLQRY
jgi:hypothetical protein